MTSILFFIISLIPPLILCWLFIWSRRRNFFLRTLILGATLVHEALMVIFPAIYSIFTDYNIEGRMAATVTADDLLLVMIGEAIFIFMFFLGLLLRLPLSDQQADRLIVSTFGRMSERTDIYILNVLIVAGCLVYAPSLFSYVFNTESVAMNQIVNMLTGVFWYTPLVVCAFLITKRGALSINPLQTLLATIPLLSLGVISLTTGIRGRIMWAISLLLIAGIFNRQKKIIAISLVIAILMLPIFAVLGNLEIRGAKESGASQTEIITFLYETGKKNIHDYKELRDVLLDSFAVRAQGLRNSVTLYQDYDHDGGGFKTYSGALFAFVPRLLWPEKPMLGSLDHTEFESATYKVMEWGYGEFGTMGPILASAHAYWEGGWIWLIVAGLITGLFWNFVFRYCSHLPDIFAAIIIFTFAAALLIDGLLTMLVPLYSIIIRCWLSLLPLLIIYKAIYIFIKFGVRIRADKKTILSVNQVD
jgi:hypothetical protein